MTYTFDPDCPNCIHEDGYVEMCQGCWEKIPHTQSFDICSKCMTQCEFIDWTEWNRES